MDSIRELTGGLPTIPESLRQETGNPVQTSRLPENEKLSLSFPALDDPEVFSNKRLNCIQLHSGETMDILVEIRDFRTGWAECTRMTWSRATVAVSVHSLRTSLARPFVMWVRWTQPDQYDSRSFDNITILIVAL